MSEKHKDTDWQAALNAPTMPLWPTAGRILGFSRSGAYAAARRGDIPVLKIGSKVVVPCAPIRKMLGLEAA